ncbi:hypothetical protein HPB51_005160 [Rhipicephalus microplus]|uniref:CCHC-type domain-containing protein n=1 Tax=Rhipicephalus microplus TaxID=6941 RepID=A0A9J6DLB0_RHIMP|nr:hypothetical protein HPB51_005160 [Rhipicephalus microplus]
MLGAAHAFAWRDDSVTAASTYPEFRALALERFDTEPLSSKVETFRNARQNAGEEARSFSNRVRLLGTATLANSSGEEPAKTQLRREILAEQVLSQFLTGLRDPVRRFVLSRDPKSFDEAIDVAAKEERNEKLSQSSSVPVRHVDENANAHEMRSRLDRLEKLLEESLRSCDPVGDDEQRNARRPPFSGRCFNCDGFGHFWRECDRYRRRQPWNTRGDRRTPENRVSTYPEFRALALERFDMEPLSSKLVIRKARHQVPGGDFIFDTFTDAFYSTTLAGELRLTSAKPPVAPLPETLLPRPA